MEGWGIAGLKCGAITFQVSLQCRGNDGVLTLGSLPQRDIAKGRVNSKVLTSSLPSGGGAYSRDLKAEPFLIGGEAVVTNDWCIMLTVL